MKSVSKIFWLLSINLAWFKKPISFAPTSKASPNFTQTRVQLEQKLLKGPNYEANSVNSSLPGPVLNNKPGPAVLKEAGRLAPTPPPVDAGRIANTQRVLRSRYFSKGGPEYTAKQELASKGATNRTLRNLGIGSAIIGGLGLGAYGLDQILDDGGVYPNLGESYNAQNYQPSVNRVYAYDNQNPNNDQGNNGAPDGGSVNDNQRSTAYNQILS